MFCCYSSVIDRYSNLTEIGDKMLSQFNKAMNSSTYVYKNISDSDCE